MKKTVGTVNTVYVYDAMGQMIAEYTDASTEQTAASEYVLADHLGSTRAVLDAATNTLSCHDYLPFGEELTAGRESVTCYTNTDSVKQKFTGKERDTETGLDYFGARYFSGPQSRFTTPDWSDQPTPIPYADLYNPQTLNQYTYSINNPLRAPDPDGHDCPKCKTEYGGETKVGGDKNWRNNNPGNLRMGRYAKAHGAKRADKDGFAIFESMEAGAAAQKALWKTKSYNDLSVSDAIAKYAPKSENNTEAYLKTVSDAAGVDPDVKVSDLTDEQLSALIESQQKMEGMKEGQTVPKPKVEPEPQDKQKPEEEKKKKERQ